MIKDFGFYDKIIVSFSGGKDSIACLLFLLNNNVPKEKIEIWHQCVDGYGSTAKDFMDWPGTLSYVEAFANHFGISLNYQWREWGFYGELMRENKRTNNVRFIRDNKEHVLETKGGKIDTKLMWPAKTASLKTRWCSGYLKIDVAARALNNIPELADKRILFITGERREESRARAKLKEAENHRCNSKKQLVHHWRPVIDWSENDVWFIIENRRIMPNPVYFLGFPRLSCRSCIFFSKDHWKTLNDVSPEVIKNLHAYEEQLGFTIDNKLSLPEMVTLGTSKLHPDNAHFINQATEIFTLPIITNNWQLPAGAFGSGGGAA